MHALRHLLRRSKRARPIVLARPPRWPTSSANRSRVKSAMPGSAATRTLWRCACRYQSASTLSRSAKGNGTARPSSRCD